MNERLLIDAEEAARLLGLSRVALWARVRRGQIPHLKVGRHVKFNPEVLAAWARGELPWPPQK